MKWIVKIHYYKILEIKFSNFIKKLMLHIRILLTVAKFAISETRTCKYHCCFMNLIYFLNLTKIKVKIQDFKK